MKACFTCAGLGAIRIAKLPQAATIAFDPSELLKLTTPDYVEKVCYACAGKGYVDERPS